MREVKKGSHLNVVKMSDSYLEPNSSGSQLNHHASLKQLVVLIKPSGKRRILNDFQKS